MKKRAGGARQFTADEIIFIMNEASKFLAKNEVIFIVASDDQNWCKQNLLRGHDSSLDRIYFTSEYYPKLDNVSQVAFDFTVMSKCDHNVVLIGTFAYWASFFAGGEVFIPLDYPGQSRRVHQSVQIARANLSRYHNVKIPRN